MYRAHGKKYFLVQTYKRSGNVITVAHEVLFKGRVNRRVLCMASCIAVVATCSSLALLCVVCFGNGLFGDLVHDDVLAIVNNQDLRPETPLLSLLHNDFWGKPMSDPTSHKSYRPLSVLSFRLNYALHGLEPWGYHAVNVLLHVACTLCFWWACRNVKRIILFRTNFNHTLHLNLVPHPFLVHMHCAAL